VEARVKRERGLAGFAAQPHTRGRGTLAEDAALPWLEARGYRVVERNHRNDCGEIDVVAWHGETLCFVEIKARATGICGDSLEAVGRDKQRRLGRAAALYLVLAQPAATPWPPACRFDVLGLDLVDGAWRHTLVQDAFQLDG
jgi:putative endonuclease